MTHSVMTEMTKKVLAESLKRLMTTKSLNKITVQEIVDECHLNRRTFYYHFHDVYELLGWIYKEEAIAQLQTHDDCDTWQEGFLNIFLYIQKNQEICLCTFHSLGRDHLENFLYSVVYGLVKHVVITMAADMRVDETYKDFLANFYTVSFVGLLLQWIQRGMKERPEQIIRNLSVTVRGTMLNALKQYEEENS
ncbi:HTH-type dhaKLM operon transcriptional activator DhaS [Peptococcaceae bacterium CEB3]|nr:HTH-type dhaKLM operon transcriptional activator DhaS [Peptococcaceae bacterium CEB3]